MPYTSRTDQAVSDVLETAKTGDLAPVVGEEINSYRLQLREALASRRKERFPNSPGLNRPAPPAEDPGPPSAGPGGDPGTPQPGNPAGDVGVIGEPPGQRPGGPSGPRQGFLQPGNSGPWNPIDWWEWNNRGGDVPPPTTGK